MGIYTGVMTATEAAAVAGFYAMFIAILFYRTLGMHQMVSVLKDTIKSTGQIGLVLGASYVFSYIISVERLPQLAGNLIVSFASTRGSFLLFTNVILFILGMFVDSAVLQLVLLPILVPIARQLGIDMVHFGLIFTLNTMIGLCTPPYGMLLFIVTGISGEKMKVIIKEIAPMILAEVVVLLVVTYIPDVVLWVPKLLGR
jgi:tripartite ATP-independent transporter DctM subunit